jgi:hypothetical protein
MQKGSEVPKSLFKISIAIKSKPISSFVVFFLFKFYSVMYSSPDIKIWPSALLLCFNSAVDSRESDYKFVLTSNTNVTRDVTETPAKKSCQITKQLDEVLARCPLYEQRTLTLKLMTMEL